MLDPTQRKLRFINRNGLMQGTPSEYKEMKQQSVVSWSPHEQALFKEKYLERPKQFGLIADALEKKVIQQLLWEMVCIVCEEDEYKAYLREAKHKRKLCSIMPTKKPP